MCKSDSATEVSGCKSPIRLNLRKIRPGQSPEGEAMAKPDTPDSVTAAAMLDQKLELGAEAQARFDSAKAKANAGDGKGCLKELDIHDNLDAKHKSTDPNTEGFARLRAQCVMLSGKCDAGKVQMRKALEKTNMAEYGAAHIDAVVDGFASMYCQGDLNATDSLRRALKNLEKGAFTAKKTTAFCDEQYTAVKKNLSKAKPRDADDTQITNARSRARGDAAPLLCAGGRLQAGLGRVRGVHGPEVRGAPATGSSAACSTRSPSSARASDRPSRAGVLEATSPLRRSWQLAQSTSRVASVASVFIAISAGMSIALRRSGARRNADLMKSRRATTSVSVMTMGVALCAAAAGACDVPEPGRPRLAAGVWPGRSPR